MKKILSIFGIFVVVIMLTACGGKVGTYNLVEMESNGQKVDAAALEQYGIKMQLVIKDEKNALLKVEGEEEKALTYDDKVFIGKDEETGEEESVPYTLDGNTLTLSKDGETMVFKK